MNEMTDNLFGERVIPGKVTYGIWQEHINRYFFTLKFVSDKQVLDIACGTGYGTRIISNLARYVIGVDVSLDALRLAKQHNSSCKTVDFVLADATYLPFRDSVFDAVASFETVEHVKNYRPFLHEIKYILIENGTLIISTPNSQIFSNEGIPDNPFHVKEFTVNEFHRLLTIFSTNMQYYGQSVYTFFNFVLQLLSNNIFSKFRPSHIFSSANRSEVNKEVIDPKYGVKRIPNFYPFCVPRFIVFTVTNKKLITRK
jgi:ubiquinone/menaquinone biosynthesis C-methylase UbiE